MKPTWESKCGTVQLYLGDCLEILPSLDKDEINTVCVSVGSSSALN